MKEVGWSASSCELLKTDFHRAALSVFMAKNVFLRSDLASASSLLVMLVFVVFQCWRGKPRDALVLRPLSKLVAGISFVRLYRSVDGIWNLSSWGALFARLSPTLTLKYGFLLLPKRIFYRPACMLGATLYVFQVALCGRDGLLENG